MFPSRWSTAPNLSSSSAISSSSISSQRRQFVTIPAERTLQRIIIEFMSEDMALQVNAMSRLRQLLTDGGDSYYSPSIDDIARSEIVTRLVHFFLHSPLLKDDAAFVLATLTSSEDTQVLIDNGTVPLFVQLLSSEREEDRILAAQALENLAIESQERRDYVLNHGAMPPLLALFTANPTLEMLRAAAATLSAFFRATPFPAVEYTNPAIPVLGLLLRLNHCDDALKSAVVVVSNLSGGSNSETIQRICHSEIISALVSLFGHSTALIQREALGTIFNIVAALDSQHTQIVVENGVLPGLFRLLTNTEDSEVMKKICQIVFNIAVLDRSSVIESGITRHIIHLLNLNDTEIKTYALRTISTITSEQNHDHIRLLVSQGCIEGLSNVLDPTEGDIVLAALGVLEVIFEVETNGGGEDFPYRRMFIQAGGLQQMDEAVFTHADNHDINLRYDRIIMGYFKDS